MTTVLHCSPNKHQSVGFNFQFKETQLVVIPKINTKYKDVRALWYNVSDE
jgi:hypothetical protein